MATVVLDYDVRNEKAVNAFDLARSSYLFREKKKKTGIEMAFEDIEKGRVSFINGPKKTGLEEALEDIANGRLTTIHIPKNRKAV